MRSMGFKSVLHKQAAWPYHKIKHTHKNT